MIKRSRRKQREQRRRRVRARVFGTQACPRASVFRSLRGITVQLIDDVQGNTLVAASSMTLQKTGASSTKTERAALLGKDLAKRAKASGISRVVFDRGGYRYHGQVAALAEALRAGGLSF